MATLGFIGGTGPEGLGLAMRLALAGHAVRLGSRRVERAEAAAATVREAVTRAGGHADAAGAENADVAAQSDIVVLVVPYEGHAAACAGLRGAIGRKIVIDAVVPLVFQNGVPGTIAVPEGSATQQAQALLPDARVVGAFHNLSAVTLQALDRPVQGDVLITADDPAARDAVMDLVRQMPLLRPVDAGPLAVSRMVEDLTALLLSVNKRHRAHATIQVVGL